MKTLSRHLKVYLSLVCIFCASSAYAAETWELKFQSLYPGNHIMNTYVLIPWTESFAKKTQDKLIINFFPANAIVEITTADRALNEGMLDLSMWGFSDTGAYPYAQALLIPFMSKGTLHATEFFWNAYENIPEIKKEFSQIGEVQLIIANAPYGLFSTKNPVHSPEDLKGKRVIITVASDTEEVKSWGATPIYVAYADVYVALQRGMGDYCYTGIAAAKGLKLQEVSKYVTLYSTTFSPMMLSMNQELIEDMPSEYVNIIRESTGKEASLNAARVLVDDANNAIEIFKKAGSEIIELTPEQYNQFKATSDVLRTGYWLDFLKKIGVKEPKEFIERLQKLSDETPIPN